MTQPADPQAVQVGEIYRLAGKPPPDLDLVALATSADIAVPPLLDAITWPELRRHLACHYYP